MCHLKYFPSKFKICDIQNMEPEYGGAMNFHQKIWILRESSMIFDFLMLEGLPQYQTVQWHYQ